VRPRWTNTQHGCCSSGRMTAQEDVTDLARPVAATELLEAADGARRAQRLMARQPFAITSSAARNVNFGATTCSCTGRTACTGRMAAPLLKLAPGEQLVGIMEPRHGGRGEPAARPTAGGRRERSRSRSPPSRLLFLSDRPVLRGTATPRGCRLWTRFSGGSAGLVSQHCCLDPRAALPDTWHRWTAQPLGQTCSAG